MTGVASLAGLSLSAGCLGATIASAGIVATAFQPLHSRYIKATPGIRATDATGPAQHINHRETYSRLLSDVSGKAIEESWGEPLELPDDIPEGDFTMIKAHSEEMECLEHDTGRHTLSRQRCTGSDRQRFKIKKNTIVTHDGYCLDRPDWVNTVSNPWIPSNCLVKLIPCSDDPIKFRTINNLIFHKDFVLSTRPDSRQVCYLENKDLRLFLFQSNEPGIQDQCGTYLRVFTDRDKEIQQCQYDKVPFKYPATCNDSRNKTLNPLNSDYINLIKTRKHCQELIHPKIPAIIPDVPGFNLAVPCGAKRINKNMLVNGVFKPRSNPYGVIASGKFMVTGLYTTPGDIFSVTVKSIGPDVTCLPTLRTLEIKVNLHSDSLESCLFCHSSDNTDMLLLRPPSLPINRPLYQGINTIRSPYGGLIALTLQQAPAECEFSVKFTGVLQAPHYQINQPPRRWLVNVDSEPPWSVWTGRRLTTILPTRLVSIIPDPKPVIDLMDQMADKTLRLWGYDVALPSPVRLHDPGEQGDLLVEEIQLYTCDNAAAHAGDKNNPAIMIRSPYNPVKLLDRIAADQNVTLSLLTEGELFRLSVIPHELAHNLHPRKLQTTVNEQFMAELTAEYVIEKQFGISLIAGHCGYSHAFDHLNNELPFSDFPSEGAGDFQTGAVFLHQIISAFPEQGWNIFTSLAIHYRSLKPEEAEQLSSGDWQKRTDYFFELLCNITHHNLIGHFTIWKIPVSDTTKAKTAHMPIPEQPISRQFFRGKGNIYAPDCPVRHLTPRFAAAQKMLLYVAGLAAIACTFYITSFKSYSEQKQHTKLKEV